MMKATLDDQLIAFTGERAASLVGLSEERLRRWAEEGVVGASLVRRTSPRNVVRLDDIHDLEALLVVAKLQEHFSHQRLREVVSRLRGQYASPLSELHWGVGDQVYFRHRTGRGKAIADLTRPCSAG